MRYSRATFLADQHQFLILKITAGVETTSLVPAAHFKFKSWLNLKAHGAFVQRAIHSRDVSFYANSHLISTFWWHLAANCKLQTANQSQWKWRLINPPHPPTPLPPSPWTVPTHFQSTAFPKPLQNQSNETHSFNRFDGEVLISYRPIASFKANETW